jgi:hypothetical protein
VSDLTGRTQIARLDRPMMPLIRSRHLAAKSAAEHLARVA